MHSNTIGLGPKRHQALDEPLLTDEQILGLLHSLKFDQIDARQMTVRTAHAKTCEWLLQSFEYLNWLDAGRLNEHHGFLWIKGKPGSGKSTIMKFAAANARKTMKDRIIISFFFNARGEDIEKSTIGTYRSLLLQLLRRLPKLQSVFESLGLAGLGFITNYQWTIESLKTLLELAIKDLGESFVVCFIDALDECEEDQIRDMIQFFEHIGELAMLNSIRFRVCFSSRHYPHITIRKGVDLVLEGQQGHSQDIINYLETELKIGTSPLAQQIRNELQEKASGTFMWVVLVISILNKEHDRGQIHALQRTLREIPSDLHELFRNILTRDLHNKDGLVLCIQWVLFAKYPLSPEELYFAILSGIDPKAVSEWDPNEITKDVIIRFILDSSKGLAEVTSSTHQRVQFIHESVRDFLLKEDGLGNIWSELGTNLQGQSHEQLKQCCLTYMKTPKRLPNASSPMAADFHKLATREYPFLKYAVQNVLYHADAAEGDDITQAGFLRSFPLPRWVRLDNMFKRLEVQRYTPEVKLLYVLAECNMSNLIRIHPSILSWFEVGKERYGPPFVAALATGSKEAVRTFVQALALHQSPGSRLQKLCNEYSEDKGRPGKLLNNFKFSPRTLLSYLAVLGDEVVFTLVLETGWFDVGELSRGGKTPLWLAASNGHQDILKLLLKMDNSNVDLRGPEGQTALSNAASYGHSAVVKLLLETGKVDVNSKETRFGQTPLWRAAEKGHDAVVKLLLGAGDVHVDLRDVSGRTPLSVAALNGYGAVVKLLLDTEDVRIDLKDRYGQTILSRVAETGHSAVVKLLLETGNVDVNSDVNSGRTPLWRAALNGHSAVVKLLLETGDVDVNVKDHEGKTLLWWAVVNKYEAIVRLLQLHM
jgi:ankyrin repeat protein